MAWIAYSGSVEILLGTIIERKEVNDLASSLFGTRYKEQRLRLANCGLPQVILLVEGDTRSVQNCPHDTLQMCMMETRVQLGFQVIQTKHIEDSVRLLKALHRRILQRAFPTSFGGDSYETSLPTFSSPSSRRRRKSLQKSRRSLEDFVFDEAPQSQQQDRLITYQELKCKIEKDREEGTRTVEAIYCGMLKQISKISDSTVSAIAQAYPTPNALLKALNGLDQAQGTALLADIGAGDKRVGEAKAREIYKVFGVETMDLADQSASSAQNEENITEATLPSVADSVPLRDHPQPSSFRQTPPRTNNLLRYDAIELDDSSSDDSDGKDDKPHAIATVTQKQAPIIDSSSENEETSPTSTTSPLPLAERIRHLRVQLKSTAEATRSAAAGGTASQRVVLRPSSREVIELLD
jgi:ERCC4-type nuclease